MTTAPSHASALMRPTVLMVEDEMLLGNVVADELEEAGYRVLSAMTGEEALALLEGAEPIDLLFTDIRLPGLIDGWHLAEAARRLRPDSPGNLCERLHGAAAARGAGERLPDEALPALRGPAGHGRPRHRH